jgi:hypothetical protein
LNTLLSIANGALQYHRGRQTGASGLMGIAVALLVVFQWKHIYPVLKALGIVDFFKRLGLVYEGEPGLTGFAIFMFIFKMSIIIMVALSLLIALAILISMIFSNEKIAIYVIIPIMGIIMLPFGLLYLLYQLTFNRKEFKATAKANVEKREKERLLGTPQEQLLRDHSEEIPREQALSRLNRLPTSGDREFLLGVTNENTLYILLPRPINFDTYGSCRKGELIGLYCSVQKFIKDKNAKQSYFHVQDPEFFSISSDIKGVIIPNEQIVSFYQTASKDMLRMFRYNSYDKYVNETQDEYFERKETILTNMKYATEKQIFDNLVSHMKMFDAPNEDIVLMMRESEKQMREEMG